MSNPNQPNQQNPSPTRAGMWTRVKGAFETVQGLAESIRGRTLGAIDNLTSSGSDASRSHHTSVSDRGRTQAETGMAHMQGYADPDVYREELRRISNSTTGASGNGHTTGTGPGRGYAREGEDHYGEHDGRPGGQNFEQQQPANNWDTQKGPSDNRRGGSPQNSTPQNADSEQVMKRDFPSESQGPSTGDDQHGRMH